MPVRPRRAGEAGFTLVVVLGALLVSALLSVAAFAAVNNDMRESGKDIGRKQALAAAEAGINDYLFHLNQDNGYWAKCTAVAQPNAVNDAWNGTLPDPRTWRSVPGSSAAYTIELLPVAPYTKCTPGDNVAASMIDRSSRSLRIRVTGRVPTAKGMDYRSLIGAVKRDGFLDFLYFTDYETSDAVWYALSTSGRPTGGPQGDVISWAANNCNKTYYYNGRGSLKWNGKYTDNNTTAPQITCSQIQFADNDVVAGPLHTNDDLYTCNNPTFGRTAQDRIESGDGYRTACGASEAPNFKGTFLTKQKAIGMPPPTRSSRRSRCRPTPSRGRSAQPGRPEHDGDRREDRDRQDAGLPDQRRHLRQERRGRRVPLLPAPRPGFRDELLRQRAADGHLRHRPDHRHRERHHHRR